MKRINTILLISLVAQLALFGSLLAVCGGEPDRVAPVSLLDGMDRDGIDHIQVQARRGKKVEQVVIDRRQGKWLLPEAHDYPADKAKVDRLLASLVGLQVSRIVDRGQSHQVELKVSDDTFERKLTLRAGKTERVIWMGKATTGGATCVRSDNRPETFASHDIKTWEVNAGLSAWLAQPAFEISAPRLASIVIDGPQGRTELSRSDLTTWHLGDKSVPTDKADKLIDQLERIQATGVLGKAGSPEVAAQLAAAKQRWTVELGLAAEDLPAQPPAPAQVPDPKPLDTGSADKTDKAAPAEPSEPAAAPPPAITERKTLTIAGRPDDSSHLALAVKGAEHVVLVSKYSLSQVTKADEAELTGEGGGSKPAAAH